MRSWVRLVDSMDARGLLDTFPVYCIYERKKLDTIDVMVIAYLDYAHSVISSLIYAEHQCR